MLRILVTPNWRVNPIAPIEMIAAVTSPKPIDWSIRVHVTTVSTRAAADPRLPAHAGRGCGSCERSRPSLRYDVGYLPATRARAVLYTDRDHAMLRGRCKRLPLPLQRRDRGPSLVDVFGGCQAGLHAKAGLRESANKLNTRGDGG